MRYRTALKGAVGRVLAAKMVIWGGGGGVTDGKDGGLDSEFNGREIWWSDCSASVSRGMNPVLMFV